MQQRQRQSPPPVPVQAQQHRWQRHSTPLLMHHSPLPCRMLLSSHLQRRQSQRQSGALSMQVAQATQQSRRQHRRCHLWTLHTKPDDAAVLAASCWRAESIEDGRQLLMAAPERKIDYSCRLLVVDFALSC
jgi:hypothetical protein